MTSTVGSRMRIPAKGTPMRRLLVRMAVAIFAVAWTASRADATSIAYTFESPQFTFGETTPLTNRAPNVGPASFLTTFASSPTANGFTVFGGSLPNVLFSGQHLIDPIGVADTLLLTFNTAIFSLQVDFGLFLVPTSPLGRLTLTTPVGSVTQLGGIVGGSFQGGTLVFNSVTPFLTAQLQGFQSTGTPLFFAIDDLVLDTAPVPEPATSVLTLTGLAAVAWRRARRA